MTGNNPSVPGTRRIGVVHVLLLLELVRTGIRKLVPEP